MSTPGPTEIELDLISELRERIKDLEVDEEYLQPKNLVRFLRARSENVSKAEEMIRKNVEWRETEDVKNLLLNYELPSGWDEHLPFSITGFNNIGGPFVVFPIGTWEPSTITDKDEYIRSCIFRLEKVFSLVQIKSKGKDHLLQTSLIVDLEGLGWKHYSHYFALNGTLTMLKYFEANYPETLRVAYLVNAPTIFGLMWKLAKPLLSPATHAKIQFLGSSSDKESLRAAIIKDCKEDQFPIQYGGSLPKHCQLSLEELIHGDKYIGENGNEHFLNS